MVEVVESASNNFGKSRKSFDDPTTVEREVAIASAEGVLMHLDISTIKYVKVSIYVE